MIKLIKIKIKLFIFVDSVGTFCMVTKRVWLLLSTWKSMVRPFPLSTQYFPLKTTRCGPASPLDSIQKTTVLWGTICTTWKGNKSSMLLIWPALEMLNGGRMPRPFGVLPPSTVKRSPFTIGMTASYQVQLWRIRKIAGPTLLPPSSKLSLPRVKLLGNLMKPSLNCTKTDTMPQW